MWSSDLNKVLIKMELGFTCVNDRIMSLQIPNHDILLSPAAPGTHTVEFSTEMPNILTMCVWGKNQDHDTILDSNGHIVEDLCVNFVGLWLDQICVSDYRFNMINLTTNCGQKKVTNYVGFNGIVTINLSHCTVFDQVMFWANNR